MPNVAGREFPYTPEGFQAAERYRQALGMRDGGLMGFRPLSYAGGGDVASVVAASPPGHFPAYITSDEARILRERGGGVAPDGGQYMANGLPAFYSDAAGADSDADADADAGADGGPSSDGTVGDVGPSGNVEGAGPSPDSGMGGGPTSEAESQGMTQAQFDISLDDAISVAANAASFSASHTAAANNSQVTTAQQQQQNTTSLVNAVNAQVVSNAQAVAIAGTAISNGGLGSMSPGGFSANNGEVDATMAQVAAINHVDPSATHGYSINHTQPTAASLAASQAFSQVNPTVTSAAFGVLGMMPGPIGLLSTVAGVVEGHGLMSLASDAAQSLGISDAASSLGTSAANAVSDAIGPEATNALSSVGTSFSSATDAISDAFSGFGTSIGNIDVGGTALGDIDFGDVSDFGGEDSTDGGDPVQVPRPPPPPPEEDPVLGEDNFLYAATPSDYSVANLDPYRYRTSPAARPYGTFKDGGMIGFRPPGYANGGMADDGTMAPGYANGGSLGFRPLGYANGGMPHGYANGDAVTPDYQKTVQDFKAKLLSPDLSSLPDWIYRNLSHLERAAQENRAFAEQLGDVMNLVGFDEYMKQLMASSPPAPEQTGDLGRLQGAPLLPMPQQPPPQQPRPPIPQMRPPPPQQQMMPPEQMPLGPTVQGMNRGGIMSLRHM